MMLYKLLSATDQSEYSASVISLIDKGVVGRKIEDLGIPVHTLHMNKCGLSPNSVVRLLQLSKKLMPEIVQGWMYHGNAAALCLKILVKRKAALVWNIRQSLYKLSDEKLLTQIVIRWGAYASKHVDRIIYNSKTSTFQHEAIGYCSSNRILIPNGFNTELFRPDETARRLVRKDLGLPESTPLVGLIARFHPMKDHENFIKAASYVNERRPEVHFLLAGNEASENNLALEEYITKTKTRPNVFFLGERKDIPRVMSSLDIAVSSSSRGEGFANTIGEAMACGIPCVVTDVGDSAWVLDDNGVVVPPRNSQALAEGIMNILDMNNKSRREIGQRARERVIRGFEMKNIAREYESLYRQVLTERKINAELLGC